ncbi:MAG: PadR family transcriptional regulator [Ignavibacteriales bacterium]|nr:PadR family transcriptional regulator [Ignavibacteriales bacterium]MCB9258476.1 PadR family transcriptional regulator [Ignavibacteriales bacterium]
MLSKISTLILGVLYEKERNPYEITKMLKELKLRKWFNIADSTVYATINNLRKQGLINGESTKEGRFPEKTVYSITAEGEFELHKTISSYLEKNDPDGSKFDIAILLLHHLSKDEVLQKLKIKLENLESSTYEIKTQILNLERERSVAFTGLLMLKHRLYMAETEIRTIKEIIRQFNIKQEISGPTAFDVSLVQ